MFKKFLSCLIPIAILGILLCSCDNNIVSNSNSKISVVTTIFPAYDFVREIAGTDDIDLKMLLKPGSEAHSYEPTPQDIITIQNCDIFIYVGGESDEWVKNILSATTENLNIKMIAMMDCVNAVEEEIVDGMQEASDVDHHNHDFDDTYKPEYDEHVWTSPKNAIKIVNRITELLIEVDQANNEHYFERHNSYIEKLNQIDSAFEEVVRTGKRNVIVFGDRFPFRYFADDYKLNYYAAFPGCSSETEASAKTVSFLINKINNEQIPVVLYPELSNKKIAMTICESTGAKPMQFNSCHNLTNDSFKSGASYISLMKENIETLKEALN